MGRPPCLHRQRGRTSYLSLTREGGMTLVLFLEGASDWQSAIIGCRRPSSWGRNDSPPDARQSSDPAAAYRCRWAPRMFCLLGIADTRRPRAHRADG
jgi:hypothetical protein